MVKNVIKISATWCQPCIAFKPIFEKVKNMEEYKDIIFSEVDIEEDENGLVERFGIQSVPTVIFLDEENNVLKKLIGSVPKSDFITILNSLMN